MSTSELGLLQLSPFKRLLADAPLHVTTRYHVTNNALHVLDQSAQHRVNWVARTAADRVIYTTVAANTSEYVESFGPFLLSVGQNGLGLPLTVRWGGSVQSGATASLRVYVLPAADPPAVVSSPYGAFEFLSVTQTADAWDPAVTKAVTAASWRPEIVTRDARHPLTPGSSDIGATQWIKARADLWVETTVAVRQVNTAGLLIREYAGG